MKWKTVISFCVILAFFQPLQAQTFGKDKSDTSALSKNKRKPSVQLSLGTSFISFYPGFTGVVSCVNPEVTIPVNKKWTLTTGVVYSGYYSSGMPRIGGTPGPWSQHYGTVYVEGRYQVNNKMALTAAGYKTFQLNSIILQNEKDKPQVTDLRNKGARIRVDYKVTPHFSLQGTFYMDKRSFNPNIPFGYGYGDDDGFFPPPPPSFYPRKHP